MEGQVHTGNLSFLSVYYGTAGTAIQQNGQQRGKFCIGGRNFCERPAVFEHFYQKSEIFFKNPGILELLTSI